MPCNSDYLNPTQKERNRKETAELYLYLCSELGEPVSDKLQTDAKSTYGGLDYTVQLCALIRQLREVGSLDDFFSNHWQDRTCRRLIDWWDIHEKADKEREERERNEN